MVNKKVACFLPDQEYLSTHNHVSGLYPTLSKNHNHCCVISYIKVAKVPCEKLLPKGFCWSLVTSFMVYVELSCSLKKQVFEDLFSMNTHKYSGDLNSGDNWITNFYLFAIHMPGNSFLLKSWPEYLTFSLLFKPSVTQPISQTIFDLKNEPFKEQTILDHSNTEIYFLCFLI